jgi:hypothetical protein
MFISSHTFDLEIIVSLSIPSSGSPLVALCPPDTGSLLAYAQCFPKISPDNLSDLEERHPLLKPAPTYPPFKRQVVGVQMPSGFTFGNIPSYSMLLFSGVPPINVSIRLLLLFFSLPFFSSLRSYFLTLTQLFFKKKKKKLSSFFIASYSMRTLEKILFELQRWASATIGVAFRLFFVSVLEVDWSYLYYYVVYMSLIDEEAFLTKPTSFIWPGPVLLRRADLASEAQTVVS